MTSQNFVKKNAKAKIFMLDNLDSFTYNLVDEFQCLGYDPVVYRNTLSADFIIEKIETYIQASKKSVESTEANASNYIDEQILIVLSPGPGDPNHAGCLMEFIEKTVGRFPLLGICLGQQALVQHYGGSVSRAPEIVHGKSSPVQHLATGAFKGLTNPLPVARYHSLIAATMPDVLTMTAYVDYTETTDSPGSTDLDSTKKLPMAIEHSKDAVLAFQFHPESILTTYGSTLLAQSIEHVIVLAQQQRTSHGAN